MNILTKAVDSCKYRIPIEVLKIAFNDEVQNWRQAPISLDEMIMNKVIRPRVLTDANIVGGETILVSLAGVQGRTLDQYSIIYEIPAELIMYRSLMSVLSVGYLRGMGNGYNGYAGTNFNQSGNDLLGAAKKVGDSMASIPNVSTAKADIIGYNTIRIHDQAGILGLYELRCVVANEENLNNISPRSYLAFSELVVLAVKSYIYNTLIVKLDSAYLAGGQELGSIKSIIEGYSDEEENYNTYLENKWRPTAFMNNTKDHERFIRLQINSAL